MNLIIEHEFAVRTTYLKKVGDVCEGHEHNFGHMTWMIAGAADIVAHTPGEPEKYVHLEAGNRFYIAAGVRHTITATKPDTQFDCMYFHRDENGDVIPEYTGNVKATQ